ncbi:MAG TPA: twin-arginine translocase subunit TatC, partial [Spirochaetes bacterium]|nr:twin-arginine translocase subunit TatC [Spirochaetota bacterium]
YLDWIVFIVIIIGIVFQLPLVITLLAKIGIVTDRSLTKFRPYALVIILVIAAIITPPDAITQVMVGGPVYLLYEVSILMARLMRKMNERKAKENEVKE